MIAQYRRLVAHAPNHGDRYDKQTARGSNFGGAMIMRGKKFPIFDSQCGGCEHYASKYGISSTGFVH